MYFCVHNAAATGGQYLALSKSWRSCCYTTWNYTFSFQPLWSTPLTDFSYTNFTVCYGDALDRLRVHWNVTTF